MVLHTPSLLSLASYRLNTMHLWIHVYVFSFSHSQLLYLLSILHSTMISSASLCLHSHKTPVLQFLTKDPFCYSHLYGVMFLTHSHTTIFAGSSQLANGPHWKMFKDCCSHICNMHTECKWNAISKMAQENAALTLHVKHCSLWQLLRFFTTVHSWHLLIFCMFSCHHAPAFVA